MNKGSGYIFLTAAGFYNTKVFDIFKKIINSAAEKKAVIITTASVGKEKNKYSLLALTQLESIKMSVDFYDFEKEGHRDLSFYDVFYVCGGNSFKLLKFAKKFNFDKEVEKLLNKGGIYVGVSAGSLILGPSIKIAGEINPDLNEVGVDDFVGLNITEFTIFPHYENQYESDIRKFEKKFHEKVLRLANNEALVINSGKILKI